MSCGLPYFLIPAHNRADWRGTCCLKAAERSENTSLDYWWHTELSVAISILSRFQTIWCKDPPPPSSSHRMSILGTKHAFWMHSNRQAPACPRVWTHILFGSVLFSHVKLHHKSSIISRTLFPLNFANNLLNVLTDVSLTTPGNLDGCFLLPW